jgi:phage shock protein PspC (stress-responsive transcriptional regulator)
MKKLYRSKTKRIIAGICGGIAEYFNIDPTIVRLLWLLLTVVTGGTGVVIYIISWIIIPEEPL